MPRMPLPRKKKSARCLVSLALRGGDAKAKSQLRQLFSEVYGAKEDVADIELAAAGLRDSVNKFR